MSQLPGPASDYIRAYLERIRDRMVDLFGITTEEASGRVASAFGSLDLLDRDTERYLGHEDPDYWAKSIYYGGDVQWWLVDEATLKPKPWP